MLGFASALAYADTWNGQAQEYWDAVTGADGSKSNVYVFYARNQDNLELVTDKAKFDVSPDLASVTATVLTAESTAEGADFYISPNAWGYNRSFTSLTIEEATLNKANLQVYNSTEGGTINASINKINGSLGSVINTGTLSIGTAGETPTTTTICGTVTNSGTMTLKGNISFDVSDMSKYTLVDSGSMAAPAAGTNGFESGTATYALVSGLTNLTKTEATITTTDSSVVSETATAVTVEKTGNGTQYYIQDGTTVQLSTIKDAGSVSGVTVNAGTLDMNAAGLSLADVDGSGNVIVSADTALTGGAVSAATGSLTVKDAQLSVGGGDAQTSSISSFSSVSLDGGTLYYNNKQDTLHNVSVESGKTGVIDSFDMGPANNGAALKLAGTTTVNGELTIQNRWNAQFVIDTLEGSGTLNIKGTDGGSASSENAVYTMGIGDFTGTIAIANSKATVKRTFDSLESMASATTNFTVTGGTLTNVCTAGNSTGEVSLGDISGEISGEISGGTVNGGTGAVTISGNVTGGTINGNNTVTISGTISGGTVNDATLTTNVVTGGTLNNVTLAASERLNVRGGSVVTMGNVTHATTGGSNGYAAVITGNSQLKVNGTADFTSNDYSKIGIENGSTLVVDAGGAVTSGMIGWSDNSLNGAVQVNAGGELNATDRVYVKTFTNDGTATVTGTLNANNISNSGTLTVDNLAALNNGANVTLSGGSLTAKESANIATLTISGVSSLSIDPDTAATTLAVNSLTMQNGAELTLGDEHEDSLVTVNTLTVQAESTLNANLAVTAQGSLISDAALTMGCAVELGEGLTLGGSQLESLLDGSVSSITLFDSVESLTLGGVDYSHAMYASEVFSNAELQNTADTKYVFSYNGETVTLSVVPEPATATLSLLALAALAARRRRKA